MGNAPAWEGYEAKLLADRTVQAVPVPGTEEEGATPAYRHPSAVDGLKGPAEEGKESLDTGWKIIEAAAAKYGDRPMFGSRPFTNPLENPAERGEYTYISFQESRDIMVSIGYGVRALGLPDNENVGLYSKNREEWVLTHYSNWSQGFRTVALYDTLGADAVAYIVGHAELKVIVCEKDKLDNLFSAVEANREEIQLQFVVQMDFNERLNNQHEKVDDADRQRAQGLGLELIGLYSELIPRGEADDAKRLNPPMPEDLAYIMYTSGTTGNPKGVMLSHINFSCVVGGASRAITRVPNEPNGGIDTHVSFLPLAHSFESAVQASLVNLGGTVCFYQGDIRKIGDDWRTVKPTLLFGVPRIFVKTYDRVQNTIDGAGFFKQAMFRRATNVSTQRVRANGQRNGFWDGIIWSKVAAQMGFDNVRILLSGAAPIAPMVAEFLRLVLTDGVVLQGYGMTETCAASFFTPPDDWLLGHVGVPSDSSEYRLIDAPECEYYVKDTPCPRGEIQIRGGGNMIGYYKNEEATAKTIGPDGWLSTGDIGRINPNGTLSIIDRRKNMFKTAQGEYIAAEKIETVYQEAEAVGQIWLYGNSFKPFVVAVVVPEAVWMVSRFKEQGLWPADADALVPGTPEFADKWSEVALANQDFVKQVVFDSIKALPTTLKSFEKVKDIMLECQIDALLQGFNMQAGTLTPSFKLKRPQLLTKYKEQLKELYAANGEAPREDENW